MSELTPQAFSERWSKSKLSERSSAQSHFIDLCHMLGKPIPAEADPDGDFYTFERSLDPGQRARLGAHYTSKDDILAIVEPVLMAPLRREWARVQEESEKLFESLHPTNTSSRSRTLRNIESGLVEFLHRLRTVRALDPACSSGNFLYVSLKQLLDLEKEVSTFAEKLGVGRFFPEVRRPGLWAHRVGPGELTSRVDGVGPGAVTGDADLDRTASVGNAQLRNQDVLRTLDAAGETRPGGLQAGNVPLHDLRYTRYAHSEPPSSVGQAPGCSSTRGAISLSDIPSISIISALINILLTYSGK